MFIISIILLFFFAVSSSPEPLPPAGVLGCIAGRKGPGRQSSLAFLQNRLLDLQDRCEASDANRGVVKGVVPLELRGMGSFSTGKNLNAQS